MGWLWAGRWGRFAGRSVCAGEVPADDVARDAGHQAGAARAADGGGWQAADRRGGVGWCGQERAAVELGGGTATGRTSWLSCDKADVDPVRFWAGFIEAPRVMAPEFGADAADLLAMDSAMSADVTASIANDAAKLPAGSAIIVDDFHAAAAGAARDMTDLVERWPAETAQLVLASRSDPPLRLHRLRMSGELCELRDRDLYFSLAESRDLLANFGVRGRRGRAGATAPAQRGVGRGAADGGAVAARHQGPGAGGAGAGHPQPRDRRVLHLRGPRAAAA